MYNLKQKNMIVNVIYSTLIFLFGCSVVAVFLFFGIKFCSDNWDIPNGGTWKTVLWQLIKSYPLWIWILALLVFQPAIVHIISVWNPRIWISYKSIPQISDFIGFITVIFYIILINITDEDGKIRFLRKFK